jgi:uracil-DNA glycosylase
LALPKLPDSWIGLLGDELEKPYFISLAQFITHELESGAIVFPEGPRIFQALSDVAPSQLRVVILGQDPYHGPGQALGRSFAVPNSLTPKPPSLKNIFKEIEADLGRSLHSEASDLSGWSAQGVLMLNTVLTVRAGEPLSHRNHGWETFTDRVLQVISALPQPIVFMLWGSEAQKKRSFIAPRHLALESAHPSPLSAYRGFLGCQHFSKANAFLEKSSRPPIDWTRISNSC